MKKRERILLGVFAALFLVIIGGGLLAYAVDQYRALGEENDGLRGRLAEMRLAISEGAEWQRRSAWLEQHVPLFTSRQEASARLLEVLQKEADRVGLTIAGKEFMEAAKLPDVDGQPAEETGYFDHASVKISLTNVQEKALFTWMHALQQPGAFLGVTRFQMNPSGQSKGVHVEVEITQYYRQKSPSKLTSARGGLAP